MEFMTIWSIFGFICDVVKLAKLADYFYARHKAVQYAKDVTNAPDSLKELEDDQQSGKF